MELLMKTVISKNKTTFSYSYNALSDVTQTQSIDILISRGYGDKTKYLSTLYQKIGSTKSLLLPDAYKLLQVKKVN